MDEPLLKKRETTASSSKKSEEEEADIVLPFQTEEDGHHTGHRGFVDIYTSFATREELAMVSVGLVAALINGAIQPMLAIILGRIWGGQAGRDASALQHNVDANLKYLFMLAAASFVANYLQYSCFMITSERINQRMKRACLASLFRQEIGFFDANPSGLLSARISEQSILVQRGTSENLGMAFQFFSQFVTGFIISFSNNYRVAAAMTICMPVITLVLSGLILAVVRFVNKSTKAYEEAGAVAEEVLRAIQTVVSFNAEAKSVMRYDDYLALAERVSIHMWIVRAVGMGVIMSTVFISLGVGYSYGSTLIATGSVDFGGVMTSVMSAMMASVSLGIMGPVLGVVAQAKSGSAVLFKLIDREPKLADGTLVGDTVVVPEHQQQQQYGQIEFRNVCFSYPTRPDSKTLNGLSFVVRPGQTCSLTGESGCGKSSAIQLLLRFYDPDSGQVLVDGVDVRDYTLESLRAKIGFVSQEPVLWDQTIADNIRMGKRNATMEEVTAAAKAADAHDFISRLPNGYLTRVNASVLSGGQKQRLAIARAVVGGREILVLDEATSALDEKSQQLVQRAIDRILHPESGPKRTAIVIAHRLSTIRRSDVIVVLENKNNTDGGRVVEMGDHATLMAIPNGKYAKLVAIQESNQPQQQKHTSSSPRSATIGSATSGASTPRSAAAATMTSASSSPRLGSLQRSASLLLAQHEGMHAFNSMLGASMASPPPLMRQLTSNSLDDESSTGGGGGDYGMRRPLLSISAHATPVREVGGEDDDDDVEAAPSGYVSLDNEQQESTPPPPPRYDVPLSRLWRLSAPESPWWFILGFVGSAVKGSTQPMLSIVISHVLSHMILIPDRIEGILPLPLSCKSSADCRLFPRFPYCLSIPEIHVSHCVATCRTSADCAAPDALCTKFTSLGISESFCVPSWMDGHSPDDVRHTGMVALGIYSLVGLVSALGTGMQVLAFGYIGEKLVRRVRLMVFASIVRQDGAFFDQPDNSPGALVSRLSTDAAMIRTLTCDFVGLIVENSMALTVAVLIAVVSSWRFSVLFVLAAPMLSVATYWQSKQLIAQNTKSQDMLKHSSSMLGEAVGNVRTVFSFNAQNQLVAMYDASLEQPKLAGIRNAHVCGIGSGASQFVFFTVYAIGFAWGSYLIGRGLLESPDLSRAFMAITMTAASVGQASARSNDFTKAQLATSNVFRIADRRPRIEAMDNGAGGGGVVMPEIKTVGAVVRFEQVIFAYPTRPEIRVLDRVDFEALPGQTVAFVGRSGCGKSSLIKLLLRFYDCEDNLDSRITINGTDLRDLNLVFFRKQIGLVGQEPVLFRGTIRDNLLWGNPDATDAQLRDYLVASNAWAFVSQFPLGLDTDVGANAKDLSGGQKQRIAIARALCKQPTILCLDEATSALDSESEKVVQQALDRIMLANNNNNKRTTFVIAHRLQTVRYADMIVVLANPTGGGGRVVEQGTHDELVKLPHGQYREMWRVTMGEEQEEEEEEERGGGN